MSKPKLEPQFMRMVLSLNGELPEEYSKMWVTVEEMHARLIEGGVDRSLTIDLLQCALTRQNKGEKFVSRRTDNGSVYYRPSMYQHDDGTPSDQRQRKLGARKQMNRHLLILPPKNYFLSESAMGATNFKILSLNNALINYEKKIIDENNVRAALALAEVTPTKTNKNDVETELQPAAYPPLACNGRNCKGHDANGIFDIAMLTDFISATNTHSASCGVAMDILVFDNSQGAHIQEIWQCPRCRECIQLDSSKMVTTSVVEPGRKYARKQPSINLKIAKASRDHGVGIVDKTVGFISESLGIKMCSKRNVLHTHGKVKEAIRDVVARRQEENMKEHVSLTRSADGYEGDVEWEHNGEKCSTSRGSGAYDGCGATRSYGNKHKGNQAAFVVTSGVTKKPIALVHYQTSCINCTRTLFKELKKDGDKVPVDNYGTQSMQHEGTCYRCGTCGPANAEEHMAKDAARQLLLNKDGTYRGDDTAIFLKKNFADNDARAPKKFIGEQNNIMGEVVDEEAEHMPDTNHTIKNLSNNFYDKRKHDRSFAGAGMLDNKRIRSICSDVRKAVALYHENIGDPVARQECIDQIYCIIPHHCGDHSKCTNTQLCRYLCVKTEHEDWSEEQIQAEVAKTSLRFRGSCMDLSEDGQKNLMKMITKRFSEENIDRIAEMGDSNACEGFWGSTTKFSEGKRINVDQTDYWKSILDYCFCRAGGNIERTLVELSDGLGLEVNSVELEAQAKHKRKRKKDVLRNSLEPAKIRREQTRIFKDVKMGKDAAREDRYRPGKVPLKESAKSKSTSSKPAKAKSKGIKRCTKCKQEHHTARTCLMPALIKQGRSKVEVVDWYSEYDPTVEERALKRMKQTKEVELLNWD